MLNHWSTFIGAAALAGLAGAQLQLPVEYPYCNVVAMQWQQGNVQICFSSTCSKLALAVCKIGHPS